MESEDPRKFLIGKFLKEPLPAKAWGREMKLAKELLSQYPLVVWQELELGYLLNSLAYFKTYKGKQILAKAPKPERLEIIE